MKKPFIALLYLSTLSACHSNLSTNNSGHNNHEAINNRNLSFNNALKCHSYSYNDGYFITADYGCIYNPNGGNKLGNIVVCLIPKKPFNIAEDQIAIENKKLNALSGYNIKKTTTFIYS